MAASIWLATSAATGCGRFGFDPLAGDGGQTPCELAIDHDEDGDGVDDACDLCPHVADPSQADRDGDAVGDACDPRPDEGGERFVFFDPFIEARPEWSTTGQDPSYDGESLFVDTVNGLFVLSLDVAPALDRIELGVRIGAGRAQTRQLTIRAVDEPGWYYCELHDANEGSKLGLTYTLDGDSYVSLAKSELPGRLENAQGILRMDHALPDLACETSLPVAEPRVEDAIPADLVGRDISVSLQGLEVWYDYFVVIRSE